MASTPLVARLRAADPVVATSIDLRNPRRVLRALERAEARRERSRREPTPTRARSRSSALDRPREVLYRRIDERARQLFAEAACSTRCGGCEPPATAPSCGR